MASSQALSPFYSPKDIAKDIDFLAEARIAAVRSVMTDEEWAEVWRKGRTITLDEAVSYALE